MFTNCLLTAVNKISRTSALTSSRAGYFAIRTTHHQSTATGATEKRTGLNDGARCVVWLRFYARPLSLVNVASVNF